MDDYKNWKGKTVLDRDGNKIGTLSELYVDNDTSRPKFATVETGLFGTKQNFFPVQLATVREDNIVLDTTEDQVKNAPQIDADEELEGNQERELYKYYGLTRDGSDTDTDQADAGETAHEDHDDNDERSGETDNDTDDSSSDDGITRSERHLHISTERDEDGRVRLKKYVITENITRPGAESGEDSDYDGAGDKQS